MNRLVAALVPAAILLAGAPASAQDNKSWTFDVIEIALDLDDEVLVRLKPVPPGREFPRSCDELKIHSTFAPDQVLTPSARNIDRAEHMEALRALLQAETAKKIVRVGSIDTGFGAIRNKPKCEVASRILIRLMEDDGVWAVYSFY